MNDRSTKLAAGALFPALALPLVGGGTLAFATHTGWRMLIVYRGRHCPLCKKYLGTLNSLLGEFQAAKVAIAAVSADPEERAAVDVDEQGWRFPVGFGLTLEQMADLGLYVSEPRSTKETDRPFAEPGLFVINPAGLVQVVAIANAPFARPDLEALLNGLKFVMANDYPIRGTLS